MEEKICRFCKKIFDSDKVCEHGTYRRKDGSAHTYYSCRKCNTEIARKYRSTKTGKENIYRAVYKSNKKNKLAVNARMLLHCYIRKGNLKKLEKCEACESRKNITAHHWDYKKPLEVSWLCNECHRIADRLIREYTV